MSVERAEEILIQVSDINRPVAFYRDGPDLPLQPTGYGDDSFETRIGGVRIVLHPDFAGTVKQAPRGAGVLLHLWVPDADASCGVLRRRGIPIAGEPQDRPWAAASPSPTRTATGCTCWDR